MLRQRQRRDHSGEECQATTKSPTFPHSTPPTEERLHYSVDARLPQRPRLKRKAVIRNYAESEIETSPDKVQVNRDGEGPSGAARMRSRGGRKGLKNNDDRRETPTEYSEE